MANQLQDLCDTQIMPLALSVLRENSRVAALINQDYNGAAAEKNATIRIPLPQDLGEADDMDTSTGSSSTDLDDGKVDLKLDQWKYKQFQMDDKEMQEVVDGGVLPSAADASVKALSNSINRSILNLFVDIPYFAGAAGTTPDAADDITAVNRVMNNNLVPPDMRYLLLDPDAEEKFLIAFKDADKTGSTEALRNASLGRLFSFEAYMDQLLPSHTKGTVGGTPAVNLAVAAGETTMDIDGTTGTNTLKKGDLFTVDGVEGQYVVTADAVAAAGAFTGVQFYPAAPAGGFPNDALITFVNSHAVNLAFHRNAFTIAMRPLAQGGSESSTISTVTDPVSGLSLRLETWRDSRKATRLWRFDALWGVKTLRPELAARLLG